MLSSFLQLLSRIVCVLITPTLVFAAFMKRSTTNGWLAPEFSSKNT